MPLEVLQIMLALAIFVTIGSGLWLMINANDVARLVRRSGFIVPGPEPRTSSRGMVVAMLLMFTLGTLASAVVYSWASTDEAAEITVSDDHAR